MSQKARFRLTVVMPFLLALPGLFFPGLVNFSLFPIAIAALFIAVKPYGVFVIAALLWSRNRPDPQLRKAIWLIPIVFALLFLVFSLISPSEMLSRDGSDISWTLALSLIAMGYGYLCVLISIAISLVFRVPTLVRDRLQRKG